MRLIAGMLASLALAVVTTATPALATTYTVNTTMDADDASPGDNNCATADGKCSLRAAIREANAHPGDDVVALPAGTFRLTIAGPGEDLAATGDLDVTENLTINGAAMDTTIIDGMSTDRVFDLKSGVTFTARDLTIRGGAQTNGGGIDQETTGTITVERVHFLRNLANSGGGILQVAGPLTVTDCVFERNIAQSGAGLLVVGTGAVNITGTTLTGNTTSGGSAAGLLVATSGTFSMAGSTVSGNTADGQGGSILVSGPSSISVSDSTFQDNSANVSYGGPLLAGLGPITLTNVKVLSNFAPNGAGGILVGSTVQVSGSEFSDNFALSSANTMIQASTSVTLTNVSAHRNACVGGQGGGLSIVSSGPVSATNLDLTDNIAMVGGGAYVTATGAATFTGLHVADNGAPTGGGLVVQTGANLSVTNSTFDGNTAGQVGGLYALATGTANVSESTFVDNQAQSVPGVVGAAYIAGATATVVNATFTRNTALTQAGGLFAPGTTTVRNSTFVNNDAPSGSAIAGAATVVSTIITGNANHCFGGTTSGGNNIDYGGSCGLAGSGDQNVDPQLAPLADNGGPTLTHLPAPTSPAIDHGAASGCPATDQRGQARPTDGNGDGSAVCDVGAVEFLDLCPDDPNKTTPGICGCGVADTDADQANGTADCLVNGELKARIARAKTIIGALASDNDPAEAELGTIGTSFMPYVKAHGDLQVANPKPKLAKLAKKAAKAVKKVTKAKAGPKLDKAKTKAGTALDAFDADVMPQT
jgi:CSLREA domain-containing protein